MYRYPTRCALALAVVLFSAHPASAEPNVSIGTVVKDMAGGEVGTVIAAESGFITVRTNKQEVQIPIASTAANAGTLLIAMTAAELDAAADRALATTTAPLQPAEPMQVAAAPQ